MITFEKDTKETRLSDLENKFKYGLIDLDLYSDIKKYLLENKKVQYFTKNEMVVRFEIID